MSEIMVTGAGGFIGRHVASQLVQSGHQVRGLGHGDGPEGVGLLHWRSGEVDLETLLDLGDKVQVVFHCAGSGSVSTSLSTPSHDFASNVSTTQAVLEFARLRRDVRVVLLSSASVYGSAERLPISVDSVLKPVSPYGFNKLIIEILAEQYATFFCVPITIVRLFSVYGEGLRKQLLWDASRKLLSGDPIFFGTGLERRDWIHVEDAARLLIHTAEGISPDLTIVNGGSGHAVPNSAIVEGLAARLGFSGEIKFNGQARPGDPRFFEADISTALATGWRPRVSLNEGLDRYASWVAEGVL